MCGGFGVEMLESSAWNLEHIRQSIETLPVRRSMMLQQIVGGVWWRGERQYAFY
jgi:hypothetical protein